MRELNGSPQCVFSIISRTKCPSSTTGWPAGTATSPMDIPPISGGGSHRVYWCMRDSGMNTQASTIRSGWRRGEEGVSHGKAFSEADRQGITGERRVLGAGPLGMDVEMGLVGVPRISYPAQQLAWGYPVPFMHQHAATLHVTEQDPDIAAAVDDDMIARHVAAVCLRRCHIRNILHCSYHNSAARGIHQFAENR